MKIKNILQFSIFNFRSSIIMVRDYALTSPSLDGILSHESPSYGGVQRPAVVNRIFDKPSGCRAIDPDELENRKVIENYFHDLYGIIIKRLSQFAIESEPTAEEAVKLQAMLQEFIKVKKLMAGR